MKEHVPGRHGHQWERLVSDRGGMVGAGSSRGAVAKLSLPQVYALLKSVEPSSGAQLVLPLQGLNCAKLSTCVCRMPSPRPQPSILTCLTSSCSSQICPPGCGIRQLSYVHPRASSASQGGQWDPVTAFIFMTCLR